MMAALFAIFSLSILVIFLGQRKFAIALAAVGIILSLLMFDFHATDILKINL